MVLVGALNIASSLRNLRHCEFLSEEYIVYGSTCGNRVIDIVSTDLEARRTSPIEISPVHRNEISRARPLLHKSTYTTYGSLHPSRLIVFLGSQVVTVGLIAVVMGLELPQSFMRGITLTCAQCTFRPYECLRGQRTILKPLILITLHAGCFAAQRISPLQALYPATSKNILYT